MNFANVKSITIPEGRVKQISIGNLILWKKSGYTNLVPTSIDTDGSIFNGTGYKNDSRLNSSAAVVDLDDYTVSGYIPAKAGDIIRVKGVAFDSAHNSGCYFWTFDSNFTRLKAEKPADSNTEDIAIIHEGHGVIAFSLVNYNTSVRYIRFSAYGDGASAIVTVNEEIPGVELPYTNQVSKSTESDGVTIYNGGLGYKNGYRVRSGGAEAESGAGACTGFISVKAGDVIRISGADFSINQNNNAINVSNSSFTNIGQFTTNPAEYGIFLEEAYKAYSLSSLVQEKPGVWKWIVPPASSGVAYIRVTGHYADYVPRGYDLIVTINEEITE